jgi:MFS transporter, DHA1 family, inner membrane transport protein
MTTTTPEARTRWLIVGLAVGTGILGAFQIGKVPVALGEARVDLGLGLIAAGWVISLFNLPAIFGGAPMGAAVARFGDRRVAIAGLLVLAAGGAVGALAKDGTTLLVSRFIEGLAFLMTQVSAPALIQRYARSDDQRFAFGIWGSYMGTGQSIVMLAAPLVLAASSWRGLWWANVAIILAFAGVIAFATRTPGVNPPVIRPVAGADLLRDMKRTMLSPGPVAIALCFGTYAGNYLVVVGFLPTILVEDLRLAPTAAAVVTAILVLANAVGNVTGGVLLQRGFARWKLLVTAHSVMGLCGIGIFSEGLPLAARFLFCLMFFGIGGILPASALGSATRLAPAPHLVPTTNGVIVQGAALGQFVAPPLAAAVATAIGGWSWSPAVLAGGAAIGIGLALIVRNRESAAASTENV